MKILFHKLLLEVGSTTFTRTAFGFEQSQNGADTFQPYFKFADDSITLDIRYSYSRFRCNCYSIFGIFYFIICRYELRYHGSELTITGYTSSTVVTATLEKDVEISFR